jgi:two-component system phosphate regulon sensor histidine kinase PhoR
MPISVRFNQQGHIDDHLGEPRWVLEIWRRPGVLEASISASRRRNFVVAVVLNAFLVAVGCLLLHHTRRARRLAEEKMNFVANVSHELYTPLTVIRGAAHNLQHGVVQEPRRIEKYAGLIIQHAEQLTEMIEQVLEVAGTKKNRFTVSQQPVSLAEVLNAAIHAAEHDTQAAGCEVQLKIAPSLPLVLGDAAGLRRVFQNLITNAAKHGGEAGWIGITAASVDGSEPPRVKIEVADRGPGIPQSEQTEIFKPFFRGAAAKARQIRGSGLGLNLVREIVEAHGGNISVTSKSGCGTIFSVHLPAAASQSK